MGRAANTRSLDVERTVNEAVRRALLKIARSSTTTASIPAGLIAMWHGLIADIPLGWALCDGNNGTPNLIASFVKGVATDATDPGATGGSATAAYTPAGSNSAPTFTGTAAQATSAVSAGTPAGSVSSDSAGTPSGSLSSDSAGTPAGSLASVSAGTPAGTLDSVSAGTPAGTNSIPTFTGTLASLTHSGTAVADHASHTHTYTDVIAHTHVLNVQGGTTAAVAGTHSMTSTATGGSARAVTSGDGVQSTGVATGTTAGPSAALSHSVTQPSAHSYTPLGTVTAPTFTGSALGTHAHTFTGSALGTHTHTFTGSALTGHSHTFTGSALSGHTHTFTGTALGTHSHTITPAGTVSAPSFTGTPASIATEPAYYAVAFIMKL